VTVNSAIIEHKQGSGLTKPGEEVSPWY